MLPKDIGDLFNSYFELENEIKCFKIEGQKIGDRKITAEMLEANLELRNVYSHLLGLEYKITSYVLTGEEVLKVVKEYDGSFYINEEAIKKHALYQELEEKYQELKKSNYQLRQAIEKS